MFGMSSSSSIAEEGARNMTSYGSADVAARAT
jgi:hypothetical protein